MSIDPAVEANVRHSFDQQPLMTMIGASISAIGPGTVEISLPHRADLTQQNGFLHAAIVTAILDSACGYAALSTMPASADVLSVEFKVNLLRPAVGERFVARARVKRAGRMLCVTEADCFGIDGGKERLVATMLGTMIRAAEVASSTQV